MPIMIFSPVANFGDHPLPTLNKNVFAIVIARACCGVRPDTGVFRNSCLDLKGSSIGDVAIFRVKVSKFQNEFMISSLLPKYEPKIVFVIAFLPCSVVQYRAEILTMFGSYFGRNDNFINSF